MDARALFPLTMRCLGARAPAAASPDDFARAVCDAHARGDIPSRSVRDLVNYEAAVLELPEAPTPEPGLPGEDELVVLAPHVRVLVFGAALPEVLEALRQGTTPKPRPARGWITLWKEGGKLCEHLLPRMEGWIVERFREPATPADAVEDDEREIFARLCRDGILIRASRRARVA